jgi:Kef-type K+ transport system membrane component KefB
VAPLFGINWQVGLALGAAWAMSSTAIVSKMLAERVELATPYGRDIMGMLLFQDLAVVAFLILLPSLGKGAGDLVRELLLAGVKAAIALTLILFLGQKPMRAWFHVVARQRSSELFMLNILLITLGLAALTELAGLSLALGAFLAGMLIAETEFRYQVEEDIKPFRDVLLGLFFVSVGMALNFGIVGAHLGLVLVLLIVPVFAKLVADRRARALVRSPARRVAAYRVLSRAGRRVRAGAARGVAAGRDRQPADHATGARRDGAVDACRAADHSFRRPDRAQADGERLARARRRT